MAAERPRPGEGREVANITQQQESNQGPRCPRAGAHHPPQAADTRGVSLPGPLPRPCPGLVQSQGRAGCLGNLRAACGPARRCRRSPLLLLIGHDQAGVQDVLLWLPRAVPGRETTGQSCLGLPCIHRSHSCSARAHCLQALAPSWSRKLSPTPQSCPRPAKRGQGLLGVPMTPEPPHSEHSPYHHKRCDETYVHLSSS